MKNIITIVILFTAINIKAQYIIPVEQYRNYLLQRTHYNHYFKDTNGVLDKFVGEWKFEAFNEKIEIRVFKSEHNSLGGYTDYCDEIYIEYKYYKNNFLIYDTYSPKRSYLISGFFFNDSSNLNKYKLSYLEPSQDTHTVQQFLYIEYIDGVNGGLPKLKWDVSYEDRDSHPTLPKMPLNMIFTKVP